MPGNPAACLGSLAGITVLYVDDEGVNRQVARRMLQKAGLHRACAQCTLVTPRYVAMHSQTLNREGCVGRAYGVHNHSRG